MSIIPDTSVPGPDAQPHLTTSPLTKIRDFCRAGLVVSATLYMVLIPTNAATAPRSIAGGLAVLFALLGLAAGSRPTLRLPPSIWLAALAWAGWSALTAQWSLKPQYSWTQWYKEVVHGALTFGVFLLATDAIAVFRRQILTLFVGGIILAVLQVQLWTNGWNIDFVVWHYGAGPWSTFLALMLALSLLFVAPAPLGWARLPVLWLPVLAIIAAMSLPTENRMNWIVFAAITLLLPMALRLQLRQIVHWRRLRWQLLVLLFVGLGFFSSLVIKTERHYAPTTTVAEVLRTDPRLDAWRTAIKLIGERPLTGYGFGRNIQESRFKAATGNVMVPHAHNLVLSQAVQAGVVGSALLMAFLAAVAWRFFKYWRSADPALGVLGAIGLIWLVAWFMKNTTDDFFFGSSALLFWALAGCWLGLGERLYRGPPAQPAAAVR